MEEPKTPLTMEQKQQLMRERLGRNVGKIYEKPTPKPLPESIGEPTIIEVKKDKKIAKGKEKVVEPNSKSWRIEIKITSVKLLYKLEIISKMQGKSKQQYFLGLLEKDLAENVDLFKNL